MRIDSIPECMKLDPIRDVLRLFNDPQRKLKNVIHVAGTNGKGSTCKFLQSVLMQSSYKVNLFTSPHLLSINERYNVNGIDVEDADLHGVEQEVNEQIADRVKISFFEKAVVHAILLFLKYPADFNIFEVGLGGKLDATNILENKILSIITPISLDHTEILGCTVAEIAADKSRVISSGGAAIVSRQSADALREIYCTALDLEADLMIENEDWSVYIKDGNSVFDYIAENEGDRMFFDVKNIVTGLPGRHQCINASTAIAASQYIIDKGLDYTKSITAATIKEGVLQTKWPGRLEKLQIPVLGKVEFILDGAHNEDGIVALLEYINTTRGDFVANIGVFACLEGKDYVTFARLIKDRFTRFLIFQPPNVLPTRPFAGAEKLCDVFERSGIDIERLDDIKNLHQVVPNRDGVRVVFFGSLYYVGFIKNYFR